MDFNSWLDAEPGRSAALAKHFNLTRAAVTHWRTNGVPMDRFADVVEFSEAALSLQDLLGHALAAKSKAAQEPDRAAA